MTESIIPLAREVIDWSQCPTGRSMERSIATLLIIGTLTFTAVMGAAGLLYALSLRVARIEGHLQSIDLHDELALVKRPAK